MSVLTKDGSPIIPGDPGYPASDGGTSGNPAYCISISRRVPQYRTVYVERDTRPNLWVEVPEGTAGATPGTVNGVVHYYISVPNPFYGRAGYINLYIGDATVVERTCYPATPGTPYPAQPARPAVPANYNLGWNGSAVSDQVLDDRGTYRFSVPSPCVGVITGFNATNTGSSYYEIDHGIAFAQQKFRVIEGGVYKTAAASYASDDEFEIIRCNGTVFYVQNAVLIYTSLTASVGPVFADCSLYSYGDSITDAALTTDVANAYISNEATGAGVLEGMTGFATNSAFDDTQDAASIGVMPSMVGTAYATVTRAAGTISVTGFATGGYGDGSHYFIIAESAIGGMEGYAEANTITPQYCIANGEIHGMVGFALAHTGESAVANGELPGLTGFSTNTEYAYQREGLIGGMLGESSVEPFPPIAFGYGDFAALEGTAFGYVDQVVDADGNPVTYGGIGQLAALTGQAYSGGVGEGEFAALTGAGVGQITIAGTGDGTFAALTGSGVGQITFVGAGASTFGALTGVGYAGGVGEGEFSGLEFTGVGSVGLVGFGDSDFAPLTGTAIGLLGLVGYGDGDLAALEAGVFGVGLGTFAALEGSGSGIIVVTATYEGYNFTFAGESVLPSHLTNFPFKRILRWKDRYIALTETGLYVLGGDTFDGDLILADVITGEDDFGIPNAKRPRSVWIPGRGGNDLAVSIVGSEVDPEESGTVDEGTGSRNRRALFGKGVRARYLAYRVQNLNGEDFTLDALGPEFDALRRYS